MVKHRNNGSESGVIGNTLPRTKEPSRGRELGWEVPFAKFNRRLLLPELIGQRWVVVGRTGGQD